MLTPSYWQGCRYHVMEGNFPITLPHDLGFMQTTVSHPLRLRSGQACDWIPASLPE
ncbi:MAG: hypothetical protein WCP01_17250 [Methylococcaceae bacterium]